MKRCLRFFFFNSCCKSVNIVVLLDMDLVLYHFKNKYPRNNMKKIKMTLMFCYFYFSGIKESEK